jgi:hypothetical protein
MQFFRPSDPAREELLGDAYVLREGVIVLFERVKLRALRTEHLPLREKPGMLDAGHRPYAENDKMEEKEKSPHPYGTEKEVVRVNTPLLIFFCPQFLR